MLNSKSEILKNIKYQNQNASEFRIPKLGIRKPKHVLGLECRIRFTCPPSGRRVEPDTEVGRIDPTPTKIHHIDGSIIFSTFF